MCLKKWKARIFTYLFIEKSIRAIRNNINIARPHYYFLCTSRENLGMKPSTLFNRVKNQHAIAQKHDISEKLENKKKIIKNNKSFAVFWQLHQPLWPIIFRSINIFHQIIINQLISINSYVCAIRTYLNQLMSSNHVINILTNC